MCELLRIKEFHCILVLMIIRSARSLSASQVTGVARGGVGGRGWWYMCVLVNGYVRFSNLSELMYVLCHINHLHDSPSDARKCNSMKSKHSKLLQTLQILYYCGQNALVRAQSVTSAPLPSWFEFKFVL